jgi:hypothetical protein
VSEEKDYFQGRVELTDLHKGDRERLRPIVGGILAGIFFFLVAQFALAQSLSHPTKVSELFEAAVKHGGYETKCLSRPDGCHMPAVLIVGIEDDNIAGQFDPRNPNFVRVNANTRHVPGSLGFNEVLVHEFVHYLQWLFGELGPQSRCSDLLRIEGQAYKAGAAYLAQFGIVKDYSEQLGSIALMSAICESMGG